MSLMYKLCSYTKCSDENTRDIKNCKNFFGQNLALGTILHSYKEVNGHLQQRIVCVLSYLSLSFVSFLK